MSLEGMSAEEITGLAGILKKMSDNPKTRIATQALMKEVLPEISTPELDQARALLEERRAREAQHAEFQQYKAEQEARQAEMVKWAEVVGSGACGYEDIEAVKKFMAENGIVDMKNGAKYWKESTNIAVPNNAPTNVFEMPQEHMKRWREGGIGNIARTAKAEAHQMIDDIRAGRVKIV
jgi:hypothetical protein